MEIGNVGSTGDSANTEAERGDIPLPEIVNLHHDLGCLMADAQGEYRMYTLAHVPRSIH